MEIASHRCRLLRAKRKTIALLEWGEETRNVDAMAIGWDRGEVADHLGCLKASEQHEVIVYEDRGENLSFPKAPKDSAAGRTNPSIDPYGQSASDRAQQRADAGRAAEEQGKTGSPDDAAKNKSRLKAIGSFLRNLLPSPSGANPSITQERAVADFFKKKAKEPAPPRLTLTRADKGQVTPPTYTEVAGAADHMRKAFLEYIAIVRATKEKQKRAWTSKSAEDVLLLTFIPPPKHQGFNNSHKHLAHSYAFKPITTQKHGAVTLGTLLGFKDRGLEISNKMQSV
ncbi:hypothetical protein HF086_003691 [Spodoptera exigua]|uniref:Uncharacterized protein n=1 Tax=Spodoptera exigua TaxID=7107 RepID=A0A922M1T4_SPOEX|nr:hypothetical protein HF086_003691 [Spodoptera exigua]